MEKVVSYSGRTISVEAYQGRLQLWFCGSHMDYPLESQARLPKILTAGKSQKVGKKGGLEMGLYMVTRF